jgi:hypothetical protein
MGAKVVEDLQGKLFCFLLRHLRGAFEEGLQESLPVSYQVKAPKGYIYQRGPSRTFSHVLIKLLLCKNECFDLQERKEIH